MKTPEQIAATLKTLEARRTANRCRAAYEDAKQNGYYLAASLRDLLAVADEMSAHADACETAEADGMLNPGKGWQGVPEGICPSVRPRFS